MKHWPGMFFRERWNRVGCLCSVASLITVSFFSQAFANNIMHANSQVVVVQWTSKGGLGQPISTVADLTVFADGRVKVGPRFTDGKVVEEQLSEADLKALRHFVFEEQDIWSVDSVALEHEVKAAVSSRADIRPGSNTTISLETEAIADAATTIIRVREGEREHKVSHYNLFAHAKRYPEVSGLQRLRAIELHLLALAQQVASAAR